jgi:sporulation and cell division protein SsgA
VDFRAGSAVDGIEGREGIGDVHVWPSADSEGGEPGSVLNIELSSSSGQAHLKAPAREVSDRCPLGRVHGSFRHSHHPSSEGTFHILFAGNATN